LQDLRVFIPFIC